MFETLFLYNFKKTKYLWSVISSVVTLVIKMTEKLNLLNLL